MQDGRVAARVVLLAPFIHAYRIPLFEEIARRLDDLHILVSTILRPDEGRPPEWDRLDIHVQQRLSLRRTWRHPSGFSEPVGIHIPYDTLARLRRYRPDVVITTEMGPRTLQALAYGLFDRRCKVIVWATVSEHNEQGRGRLRVLTRRWVLRRADAILVNGASGARYVTGLGADERKLYRVPYTAATTAGSAPHASRDGGVTRLLYVGQLVERKGLTPFLVTLARWARDHPRHRVELWLVGAGVLRSRLEEAADLPTNVELRVLDAMPNDRLAAVYADVDIFAFPTLSDEWGVVVNEALTAGVPVLGSLYSQAVEELVADRECGWVFRPDVPEEAYDALDRALQTPPERRREMGRRGQDVIRRLAPEHVARRVVRAVADVV